MTYLVRSGLHGKLNGYWLGLHVKQTRTTIFRKLCNASLDEINYTHTRTKIGKIALLIAAGPAI